MTFIVSGPKWWTDFKLPETFYHCFAEFHYKNDSFINNVKKKFLSTRVIRNPNNHMRRDNCINLKISIQFNKTVI